MQQGYWVTGFSDAESSFIVLVRKKPLSKTGWSVELRFVIGLHEKDLSILEYIRAYFGVGTIIRHGKDSLQYRVGSPKDLKAIIDHFDKFKLITKKRADYELFKSVLAMVNRKEHLTVEGLHKIVNIRASVNRGLSAELKDAFPNNIPVPKPQVEVPQTIDPNWLSGFVSGEGCFFVGIGKSKTRVGYSVQLMFLISQHSRDQELMERLVSSLGCGKCYPHANKEYGEFIVRVFSDITDKIIPFFEKYPIKGMKVNDFADLCKVAELMKNKDHLNPEGLNQIIKIKAGMNKGR